MTTNETKLLRSLQARLLLLERIPTSAATARALSERRQLERERRESVVLRYPTRR